MGSWSSDSASDLWHVWRQLASSFLLGMKRSYTHTHSTATKIDSGQCLSRGIVINMFPSSKPNAFKTTSTHATDATIQMILEIGGGMGIRLVRKYATRPITARNTSRRMIALIQSQYAQSVPVDTGSKKANPPFADWLFANTHTHTRGVKKNRRDT